MPVCAESADSSNHMARNATAFWQKTQTTMALKVYNKEPEN